MREQSLKKARRYRGYLIDDTSFTSLLSALTSGDRLPFAFDNAVVPPDALVAAVSYKPEYMGFGVVFMHESYPSLAEGEAVPFEAMQWRKPNSP